MAKWTIPDTPSPEAIVKAALERAAQTSLKAATFELDAYDVARLIRVLASNPAEVAAIISAATQLDKAGDEINERSEEEDRG
jgi:uncharacterized protein (DUF1778 family)